MNATNIFDATGNGLTAELAPTPEPPTQRIFPLEFRGSGAEYFRIWIVNLLLSILSLGIFSAWAKVRRQRYFYGNTFLDGHAFTYHAPPLAILRGRLIVFIGYVASFIALQLYPVLLWGLVPLVAVSLPWILLRSRRFQMRMTSWRNLHFGFTGGYLAAVNAFIGWYVLAAVAIALLATITRTPALLGALTLAMLLIYPYWVYKRVEFSLDHVEYGDAPVSFLTQPGRFFKICIATAALSLVVYVLFIYLLVETHVILGRVSGAQDALERLFRAGPRGWGLGLLGALLGFGIAGMYRAWFLNAAFGGVMIHQHILRSRVHVAELIRIKLTNLLGIVFTLGLYYPFAKVRQVRYQVSCMALEGSGRFEEFGAAHAADTGALGEEAGDFFDVDLGL